MPASNPGPQPNRNARAVAIHLAKFARHLEALNLRAEAAVAARLADDLAALCPICGHTKHASLTSACWLSVN